MAIHFQRGIDCCLSKNCIILRAVSAADARSDDCDWHARLPNRMNTRGI